MHTLPARRPAMTTTLVAAHGPASAARGSSSGDQPAAVVATRSAATASVSSAAFPSAPGATAQDPPRTGAALTLTLTDRSGHPYDAVVKAGPGVIAPDSTGPTGDPTAVRQAARHLCRPAGTPEQRYADLHETVQGKVS